MLGPGPHFIKRINLAAVSQRLRNTVLANWDPVGRFVAGGTVGVSVRATCASKSPYHDEVETPEMIIKCVRSIKISIKDHFTIHKFSMITTNQLTFYGPHN